MHASILVIILSFLAFFVVFVEVATTLDKPLVLLVSFRSFFVLRDDTLLFFKSFEEGTQLWVFKVTDKRF